MLNSHLCFPRNRQHHNHNAFTLVELLVVIGIVALLIAILLPALNAARRAAANAACLANLHQIGQAIMMYKSDTGRVPFFCILRNNPWAPVPPGSTGNSVWWIAFSQGGMTTHSSITSGYIDDDEKPLNKYLYKGIYDQPWLGTKAAPDKRDPRDVWRCPADDPGQGLSVGAPTTVGVPLNYLGTSVASPYQLYGTSYVCNRGFLYHPDVVAAFYKYITLPVTYDKVDAFNRAISRIAVRWPSSEVYAAAEIRFLWAIFYNQAIPGAHHTQSIHNAVFLDGHAAPAYISSADIARWGPYVPNRYVAKDGDGWRENGTIPSGYKGLATSGQGTTPWIGSDPMGGYGYR